MTFGADRSRHGRAPCARAGVQTSRASSPPAVPGGLRFNTQTHPLKTETDRFETVAHRLKTETDCFETVAHRLKTETDRFETVAHPLKTETGPFRNGGAPFENRDGPFRNGGAPFGNRDARFSWEALPSITMRCRYQTTAFDIETGDSNIREVSASADDADRRRFRTLICVSSASSADKQEKRAMRRRRGRSGVAPTCQRKLRVAVPFENHRRARTPGGCRQECLHYAFLRSGHPRVFTSANVISELA